MKLKVFSQDGKQVGEAAVSDDVFGGRVNTALLHQVLTAYRANQRQGTAKAKTRSEVSGGGAKPWKQKGTGRARSGSNTSPIWIRGAKAFGPRPRSYWSRIPKAVRILALRHALSSRVQDDRMMVVESISVEPAKTRTVAAILKALPAVTGRTLIVTDGVDQTLYRCGKNIKNLAIVPVGFLNAAEVMRCEMVILGAKGLVGKIEKAVSA